MSIADASVLVAAFVPEEVNYSLARAWLRGQIEAGVETNVPAIALAEVGGAIRRVTGQEREAKAVVAQLQALPGFKVHAVSVESGLRAARLAAEASLRGCDAVYVALAEEANEPLVSLDQEQLSRAAAVIIAQRP